jgi:hypothetical protein
MVSASVFGLLAFLPFALGFIAYKQYSDPASLFIDTSKMNAVFKDFKETSVMENQVIPMMLLRLLIQAVLLVWISDVTAQVAVGLGLSIITIVLYSWQDMFYMSLQTGKFIFNESVVALAWSIALTIVCLQTTGNSDSTRNSNFGWALVSLEILLIAANLVFFMIDFGNWFISKNFSFTKSTPKDTKGEYSPTKVAPYPSTPDSNERFLTPSKITQIMPFSDVADTAAPLNRDETDASRLTHELFNLGSKKEPRKVSWEDRMKATTERERRGSALLNQPMGSDQALKDPAGETEYDFWKSKFS